MAHSPAGREIEMKLNIGYIPLLFLLCVCCGSNDPHKIIDQAIHEHGGNHYKYAFIEFDFRDKHYTASRNEAAFTYTRSFEDSSGKVRDILTNNFFNRDINGERVELTDQEQASFQSSV